MTNRERTNQVLALINTIDTLVDNFPMSILDVVRGKTYESVLEFLLDALYACGVTPRRVTAKIIEKIFDVGNSEEVYKFLGDIELNSPFLEKAEDLVKVVISDILTAILSCGINPMIPDWMMDETGEGIAIDESLLDFQRILNIQPTSEAGKCYYNVKNYYTTEGDDDNLTTPNLYMSHDLNAFIWYCLNIGTTGPIEEKNKMVWDNRRGQLYNAPWLRDTPELWGEWEKSNTTGMTPYLHAAGDAECKNLFPIMQLEKNPFSNGYDRSLIVKISSQTYQRYGFIPDNGDEDAQGARFNKTIYKFNNDYLKSIRILEPKIILTSIVNALLGGLINIVSTAHIGVERTFIEGLMSKAIKTMIERDDYESNDCYYTFDNDTWNEMLNSMELSKYGAKMTGGDAERAAKISREDAIAEINNVFNGERQDISSKINALFSDVSVTPGSEASLSYNLAVSLNLDVENEWLSNLILTIATPIINSVLSPQVMLLFYINFEVMGITVNTGNVSFSDLMAFIVNKVLAIIVGIVRAIKDMIVEILYDIWEDVIRLKVEQFLTLRIREQLRVFQRLLNEALQCIPTFQGVRLSGQPDEVNYADIIPPQTIPESSAGKCDI